MALTPSSMVPLRTPAPDFALSDTEGRILSLASFEEKPALLVMFICNHCPFVKHLKKGLAQFAGDYQESGLGIVAINSNDASTYPADSPEKMAIEKREFGYPFPYLYDESQSVAKAYDATCTPDFFLYDRERRLVYRGQFDDSRPGGTLPVTGRDLRAAVDAVLKGDSPSSTQKPSIGCNIKWK